jgi:hypothetical protein
MDETGETGETNETDETLKNDEIGHLTLELLVNKTQYNKIIHKMNPIKLKEREIYFNKIKQYKTPIMSIFEKIMKNPEEVITTDINESLELFIKTCIKHLELDNVKEIQYIDDVELREEGEDNNDEEEEEEEDETLFGQMNNNTKSYWGEKIHKNKYSYLNT